MKTLQHRGFQLLVADTVADMDRESWREHASQGHPFKMPAYFRAVERGFAARRFAYVGVRSDSGRLVGQFILTLDSVDLVLMAHRWVKLAVRAIRKIATGFLRLRLVTVGTFESVGRHWWWHDDGLPAETFVALLGWTVGEIWPESELVVVRDLMRRDPQSSPLGHALRQGGYVRVANLPLAVVRPKGGGSDGHYRRLRRKARASIRKLEAVARSQGLRVAQAEHFRGIVDECYPLYVNVHRRARVFQREAIPVQMFRALAELPRTRVTTARWRDGKLVGFILTGMSSSVASPCLVGLDYDYVEAVRLYHQLLWAEITDCIDAGVAEIDLGITSYFVKQQFGAELEPMDMWCRCRWRFVGDLVGRLLPALLAPAQPRDRRAFRNAGAPWKGIDLG